MGDVAEATKRCLSCAESIHAKALKCKHCGAGQPGDGVTEPPCEKCGGHVIATTVRIQSGGITFLGIMLILGGILGLPLFGLGVIGLVAGIIIIATVKNKQVDIVRCLQCKAPRKHRLAPFYKP